MIRHHWRLRSVSRRVSEVEPEPEQAFDEPEQESELEVSDDRATEWEAHARAHAVARRIGALERQVKGLNVVLLVSSAIILWLAVNR